MRDRYRSRVLVTTHEGATYDGVLYEVDDQAVVLRSAAAVGVGDKQENVPLDGELILFTVDVAFIQKP